MPESAKHVMHEDTEDDEYVYTIGKWKTRGNGGRFRPIGFGRKRLQGVIQRESTKSHQAQNLLIRIIDTSTWESLRPKYLQMPTAHGRPCISSKVL